MRYPSNIGQPVGFSPVPVNPPYPQPYQMEMPISVTYHYGDGSFSGPQMIQNCVPVDNGYNEFSFNPNALEFIPSYWKLQGEQPYNGTMMTRDYGNSYEESYNYGQGDMLYVPSSSEVEAIPTPIFEGGKEPENYSLYTMPPPGQDAAAAENSQTYPKAPSNIVHQVQDAITTNTIEASGQCKDTCCSHKESLPNDEAEEPTAVESPKKATVPDDDAKTEKIEVVPVQCFPLYGFIGFHYGMPDPPLLPEPQKLLKATSSKDTQSRLIIQSVPAPPPKSTSKEQAVPLVVPQYSVMPLPILPIPQVPIVPSNFQSLSVIPSKKNSNPEQYTCLPPGVVKVAAKNVHYVHPTKLPQQTAKK